jgi:hypothetical protein
MDVSRPLSSGHTAPPCSACLSFPSTVLIIPPGTTTAYTRPLDPVSSHSQSRALVVTLRKVPSSGISPWPHKKSGSPGQRQTFGDCQDEFRRAGKKSFACQRRRPRSIKATAHAVIKHFLLSRVAGRCLTPYPNRWPAKFQRAA